MVHIPGDLFGIGERIVAVVNKATSVTDFSAEQSEPMGIGEMIRTGFEETVSRFGSDQAEGIGIGENVDVVAAGSSGFDVLPIVVVAFVIIIALIYFLKIRKPKKYYYNYHSQAI